MIKKLLTAAILAIGLIQQAHAADYTLRLNHTLPAAHLRQKDAELFREMVGKATNGRVDVQIFPAGQLFKSDQEAIKAVRSGSIEGAMVTTGDLAQFVPAFNLYETPFLITSYAQLNAVLDSPISAEILAKLDPLGIKGLVHTNAGSAIIATHSRAVTKPDDMKGIRLRAAAGKIQIRALELLGASAIQLPVADIAPALERGTVEGLLSTPSAFADMQIGSIAKYGTWTSQQFFPPVIIVNAAWWKQLPDDLRVAITGMLKEYEQKTRALNLQEEDKAISSLKAQGVAVGKLDPAGLASFQKTLAPMLADAREQIGADLFDRAQKVIQSAQ